MASGEDELTVAQLAVCLEVPAERIWSWWVTGEGPPPRPGPGIPRWDRAEVAAWVADGGLRRAG